MYENSRNLFQQQVSAILKQNSSMPSIFEDIFKFVELQELEKSGKTTTSDNWKDLLILFREVGLDNFVKVLSVLEGKTIRFPGKTEMEDSITVALCYYYKYIECRPWKEIKEILNLPNLNSIKHGIRIRALERFIKEQMLRFLTK